MGENSKKKKKVQDLECEAGQNDGWLREEAGESREREPRELRYTSKLDFRGKPKIKTMDLGTSFFFFEMMMGFKFCLGTIEIFIPSFVFGKSILRYKEQTPPAFDTFHLISKSSTMYY